MGSEGTMGKAAVIGGDVVVYEEKKGRVRLEVRLEGETPRTARAALESPADCRRWGASRRRELQHCLREGVRRARITWRPGGRSLSGAGGAAALSRLKG